MCSGKTRTKLSYSIGIILVSHRTASLKATVHRTRSQTRPGHLHGLVPPKAAEIPFQVAKNPSICTQLIDEQLLDGCCVWSISLSKKKRTRKCGVVHCRRLKHQRPKAEDTEATTTSGGESNNRKIRRAESSSYDRPSITPLGLFLQSKTASEAVTNKVRRSNDPCKPPPSHLAPPTLSTSVSTVCILKEALQIMSACISLAR
ncbi:hypothetical protein V8C42DRAFT_178994 [Trichoderma barbatum]